MQPNEKFKNLDLRFWSVVKLLNQRLGYFERKTKQNPDPGFVVPTPAQVISVFTKENLNYSQLVEKNDFTDLGQLVAEYMLYRRDVLTNIVEPNLMRQSDAKDLFYNIRKSAEYSCPFPMNKQKGDKQDVSFLTGIVNMLLEQNLNGLPCNYNPGELTAFTKSGFPERTLSRRVDGAFPSVINPLAIWEIKEYYYTTTFGSRVADGVYETQLDGWELSEVESSLGISVDHYLIVDDHFTWWEKGRSYLCRLVDAMHVGLVTEVIFGREVESRIPAIAKGLAAKYEDHVPTSSPQKAPTPSQLELGLNAIGVENKN